MNDNDDRTAVQASLIREVNGILKENGIDHWLFGGWGVDFLVGAVTRAHDDIEFVIWQNDAERAGKLLAQNGFSVLYGREDGMGWLKSGEKLEFDFLIWREDGMVVTPGWEEWPWPPDAFVGPPGHLGGITCPVVSATAQLETRELYQHFRPGIGLRDKDRSDIAFLREVIAKHKGGRS